MRMMTGALLILASAGLFHLCYFAGTTITHLPQWMEYYAYALTGIGWAFLIWGLIKDLTAELTTYRKRRPRGDR
jgi:protein-S-isoprenylcysteine O-methyltransferase Ste14